MGITTIANLVDDVPQRRRELSCEIAQNLEVDDMCRRNQSRPCRLTSRDGAAAAMLYAGLGR